MSDVEKLKKFDEDRFKALFKNIPIPTYAWQKVQRNLILIDYNLAAEEITKGQIKRFMGTKASELYMDNPEIIDDLNRCANERVNFSKEMEYNMISTGENKFLNVNYGFVPPNLVLVHTEDITERKLIEQKLKKYHIELEQKIEERTSELKESEEKYRNLVENISDAIIEVEVGEKFEYASPQIYDIFGYTQEEIIGMKSAKNIHPDDFEEFVKAFKKAIQSEEKRISTEYRTKHRDGHYITVSLRGRVYKEGEKFKLIGVLRDITEKKITAQKLKDSEEKYRTLVEKSLQGICILQNIKIVFANNALVEILGYSINELLSLSSEEVIDLIHPEDREIVLNRHKQRLEGKSVPPRYDFQIIRKDKKVRIVEMYATVIEYEGKTAVQEVFIDITERKKVEQKLKESEERYRLITENANDLIATLDDKFKFEYINENAYLNILGLSNKDLIGKLCLSFVHPDDLKHITKKLIKGFEVGRGEEELRFRNKAGEYIWVDVKGKTYLDKDGNKKAIVISRDITDRKNTQQRLKESEFNLRKRVNELNCLYEISKLIEKEEISLDKIIQKTLKLIPEAFQAPNLVCARIILDNKEYKTKIFIETEYKIATHIKVHEKLLDIEIYYLEDYQFLEEEIYLLYDIVIRLKNLLERKEAEKMVLDSEERLKKFMDSATEGFILFDPRLNVIETNQALSLMMNTSKKELVGKNILKFMPSVEKSGIYDKFLEVIKTDHPFVIDDITSHPVSGDIHFSLSAFKVGTGLGIIITDITKHKQVEKELKEINRLKTELLRRASHELKTPLVSIKGNADLMLNLHYDKMDSEIISFVEQIKEGCLRLEDLISDILESSKLESGQIRLKLGKEDLAFLINFCVNEVKGLADTRNQKISMEIHDKLITKFEKERIYEVIVNLLSNAIKYTPPEGIIKVKSEIKENFYVISIQDNGIGFTEAEKEQIFKQFGKIERYGQGWDLGIEGTGLGLYISKKIIELHGGKIWIESEGRDKGSTLYFSLPIITD